MNEEEGRGEWQQCAACGSTSLSERFEPLLVHCSRCSSDFEVTLPTVPEMRPIEGAFRGGLKGIGTWTKCMAELASMPEKTPYRDLSVVR